MLPVTSKRLAVAAAAAGILAAGALTLTTSAANASTPNTRHASTAYSFTTRDNARDLTFNQLLGINNGGTIAGYFGSGAAGHPNKGYLLTRNGYVNENFPGSVQTQVTGLNNRGVTVGFWSSMNNANQVNDNHGFVESGGHFRTADFPGGATGTPPVDQLLGVNDLDIAVGFYTDANGNNHGYAYDITRNKFSSIVDPNAPSASLTAAAINDSHDVAGVYTNAAGRTDGFLLSHRGQFTDLSVPGASATMALGVNSRDEVVGVYVPSSNAQALDGFTWTPQHGFTTVDDPNGMGTTTINGVNDFGQLVGFYVDGNGNTDGFIATPRG